MLVYYFLDGNPVLRYAVCNTSRAALESDLPNVASNLYIDVRYGDIAADYQQVGYTNNLWEVLQELLRRLGGDQQVE